MNNKLKLSKSINNTTRIHRRGILLTTLEKETILTSIKVIDNGHFIVETEDWNSYWKPIFELGHKEIEDRLDTLHAVWLDYIRSGLESSWRQEYCYRYFSLLDNILSLLENNTYALYRAMRTFLGFECFGITRSSNTKILAAGTSTLRNPCYLLTKLKMPDALDDPQFLPFIMVGVSEKPELFYHYRQYTLSSDSPISLMLYPSVSEANRSLSFKLINSLAGGVSCGNDPRTHERTQRLCRDILYPMMQTGKFTGRETISLELVDVGAGSGSLTSAICHQIQSLGSSTGFEPKFRLWSVDLEPADPNRFFRTKSLRGLVDSLTFLGNDYRNWLSKPQPLPATKILRIALVSRLFNNLSNFSIVPFSKKDLSSLWDKQKTPPDFTEYKPSCCLAPDGSGVKSLAISNVRFALRNGRTFAQISLSDFYRGLHLMSASNDDAIKTNSDFFLPIRSFNPECLITRDGQSVISRLVENCDYVIIEDADLRVEDLIDHLTKFSLHSINALDMTKPMGLAGNYAYVIWSKTKTTNPALSGELIW